MSGSSSNLVNKQDSPAHKHVADFVRQGGDQFSLDGERGAPVAKLCRRTGSQMQCTDIAMEAKELFAAMQSLSFFCVLPQDPSKTHIECTRIPQ